jgi:cbb3-type cytochrome oxidase subunit 3
LAVVFGTIAVVGFVVGVLVFKNRQGKKKAGHEKGPHPRSTFGR